MNLLLKSMTQIDSYIFTEKGKTGILLRIMCSNIKRFELCDL